MSDLKIGIDGRELQGHPTGVGRYLRSLLRRFADLDRHRFVVYSSAPVTLPVQSDRIFERVLRGGSGLLWEQLTLEKAIDIDRIDVLLSPAYSCPLFTRVPRVTAIHDLSFFALPDEFGIRHGLRRRVMARASANRSRSLLACSEFTRGEISRHLGAAAAEKTVVVPLGPDDDLPQGPSRAAARQSLGLDDDTRYVITIGTILRRRNVGTLVRAVARLAEVSEGALRLGIVGENRSLPFEDIVDLARSLGCEDRVSVTGFVTDAEVAEHYAAADVAAFLSEYEGFGLPALEAMSRGVPTLVANGGSLKEMFASGAVVVEPEVEAVAETLRRLTTDPAAAEKVRARGLACAATFSWERAARETLTALERAVR